MSQQFTWTFCRGDDEFEVSCEAECTYKGYAGSRDNPPEEPEFEIISVVIVPAAVMTLKEEEALYDFVAENWNWEEGE